ncbi:MAG: EI24 domain-containing protein, partial [Planctomycetota bacterium]
MDTKVPERLKKLTKPLTSFADGIMFYVRGLVFLTRHPRLWPYAILPFLINMVIVTCTVVLLYYFLPDISGLIWTRPGAWYYWFLYVPYLIILGFLVLILGYILFFMILPGIVGPPFKGKLTRYTRQILKKTTLSPVGGVYVDVIEPTIIEIRKALRLLLLTVILLPL